MGKQNSMFMD